MDANIYQKFVCNLNGLLMRYKANIASKGLPLGAWGRTTFLPIFGLVRSWRLLEALGGLLE
eukprot:4360177-Karenia_brevis.AAC.1